MYCKNCGTNMPDGSKFCPSCGADNSVDQNVVNAANGVFDAAGQEARNAFNDVRQNINGAPNYGAAPASNAGQRLQDDRSLIIYILLTIITCGIYSYYFVYKMAHDVNIACEGDGEKTSGLVAFIVLSFVTCGIYSWIWQYGLANRLAANAPRYGMNFQENGSTVMLWLIFGAFICGIGPFVAMNILIKNTNKICNAYNRSHGL